MRKLPRLKAVQAFEAAARLGSVIGAAEELRVTPSAVSHQIRFLEDVLGLKLFHRVHRSLVLTDAGQRYAEEVAEAFGRIEAATRNIARTAKSDILTIHVVPSLAAQWLMPRISRFSTAYPDIDIRLNASAEPVDLTRGVIDFDIRYGTALQATGTQVEPFPQETIVVLCAPSLLEGAHPLRAPSDLRYHALIHSEVNLFTWRDWLKQHPQMQIDLERGHRFDRSFMAISAAVDGRGVCLESKLLVERELESGRLVMPFGPERNRMQCHSLVYLKSRARIPKLRAFRDWLFQALNETAA